jgi:hypothetical protein
MQRKVIYVAGPYRGKDENAVFENIMRARAAARKLWLEGWVVICPHLNTMLFGGDVPDSVWLEGDIELLQRCDAIFVLNNSDNSKGTQNEIEIAKDLGLEIIQEK